jgi:hypothetical protein
MGIRTASPPRRAGRPQGRTPGASVAGYYGAERVRKAGCLDCVGTEPPRRELAQGYQSDRRSAPNVGCN